MSGGQAIPAIAHYAPEYKWPRRLPIPCGFPHDQGQAFRSGPCSLHSGSPDDVLHLSNMTASPRQTTRTISCNTMLGIIPYLLLTFLHVSALAFSTDITPAEISPTEFSTTPSIGTFSLAPVHQRAFSKRALDLPNNWHFVLANQPALIEPIELSAPQFKILYDAVIKHASKVPVPIDHDASFKLGYFVMVFNGNPEDGKPLDWPTIREFCKRMRIKAEMGEVLVLDGWLLNKGTGEQMYVTLGMLQED